MYNVSIKSNGHHGTIFLIQWNILYECEHLGLNIRTVLN